MKMYKIKFCIKSAVKNICRYKRKSILSICICILIILLLNIYLENIRSNQNQLEALPEAVPVTACICNLNGTMDAGIYIKEEIIDALQYSSHVEDEVFTVQMKMGFGEFAEEDYAEHLHFFAVGVNDYEGVPGLQKEDIKMQEGTTIDFLSTHQKACLMEEDIMKEEGLHIGDEITITSYYFLYEREQPILIRPLSVDNFQIVGVTDLQHYTGELVPPNIIVPFEAVRDIFHEKEIKFTADSASFRVADPLNLNEFKTEMKELGMLPVLSAADYAYAGDALSVKDETFRLAAEQLQESLTLLYGMLPFIFLATGFTGYVTAYLLIQNRKAEYAIMRSVGNSSFDCFRVLFLENIILVFASVVIGSLVVHFMLTSTGLTIGLTTAGFSLFYLCGIAVALAMLGRLNVMTVLTQND